MRLAELSDLERLVALYQQYELEAIPAFRLWSLLRNTVARRMIMVAEQDGRLLGAHRVVAWSRRWAMWDELTVVPDARREGLGWALVHRGAQETSRRDRRWMTPKHPSNPMAFPDELGAESGEYVAVGLLRRRRFPGQLRMRRTMGRLEDRVGSTPLARRAMRSWARA